MTMEHVNVRKVIMVGKIKLYNRWGFLECEHSLGKYYRSLFKLTFGLKLQRPCNDEHITIISPEDNIDLSQLHFFNDQPLNFELSHMLWTNGGALWLDVQSIEIEIFRKRLGLISNTDYGLHFCIGYKE